MTQGSLNGLNSGKELAKLKGVLRDNPGEGLKTIVVLDKGLEGRTNLVAGANKQDYHYRNVTPGRDFTPTLIADIRNIIEGELDPIGGEPLRLGKAVEIGHIFKLGYKYSESMGARVLDANGKEVTPDHGLLRHRHRAHPHRRHRIQRGKVCLGICRPSSTLSPPPLRPSRSL